jgi:hypothetical protein
MEKTAMPVEELPDVPTLEEMYQIHKHHRMIDRTNELDSDEQQRHAWFLGADAVNGKLLVLLRDKDKDESVASFVTKVLEAWDAEILEREVARATAAEAVRRSNSEGAKRQEPDIPPEA